MEQMEMIVSWMREAANNVSQNAFEPGIWVVLFAVLVLVSFLAIVRSLNRLARQLSSAVTELSEIRSILREMERTAETWKGKPLSTGKEEKDIRKLPLREGDDRF